MHPQALTYGSWVGVLVTTLLWCGFGFMVWKLSDERTNYALLKADVALREEREKAAAELRTLIRDTRVEREALERLSHTDVLAAAATIEAAGNVVGVPVTIESAVTSALSGVSSQELQAIVVVAKAEGSLQSLMAAASLFESLPFPSVVESYDIQVAPATSEKRATDTWRMTTRIRILTQSQSPGGV